MARRRKQSLFDALVELASLLPPWLSAVLALVSYLVLSALASRPIAVQSVAPGQIGEMLTASMWMAVFQVAQYAVPVIFGVGAVVAFFRARKGRHLLETATGSQSMQAISGMSWREFEQLVAAGFRLRGYTVHDMGGQGPDGGVDLVLSKDAERYLVQCKQWRATKVGVAVVRELYGVMAAEGAAGGFVVTSGSFTEEAVAFASGRNIQLLAGSELKQLLASAKSVADSVRSSPEMDAPAKLTLVCPRCGSEMKVRRAKKGSSAGSSFLGCSRYPACRGTLPL